MTSKDCYFLEIRGGRRDEASILHGLIYFEWSTLCEVQGWNWPCRFMTFLRTAGGYKENHFHKYLGLDVYGMMKIWVRRASSQAGACLQSLKEEFIPPRGFQLLCFPEMDEVEVNIRTWNECEKRYVMLLGSGGQSVWIQPILQLRLTHNPSGLVVTAKMKNLRSKNFEKATESTKNPTSMNRACSFIHITNVTLHDCRYDTPLALGKSWVGRQCPLASDKIPGTYKLSGS